jgi:hypothetical protein
MRPVCRRMVPSLAFAVLFVASSYASTLDAPVVRVVAIGIDRSPKPDEKVINPRQQELESEWAAPQSGEAR